MSETNEASVQSVVVPMPNVFLVVHYRSHAKRKFSRHDDGTWLFEIARPGDVFTFVDLVSEQTARYWFDNADSVWVPVKA
jgi:hypothetical protein